MDDDGDAIDAGDSDEAEMDWSGSFEDDEMVGSISGSMNVSGKQMDIDAEFTLER